MSTASSLAANRVRGCSSLAAAALGSCVRKGCNSPKCASLVMTAGTDKHSEHQVAYMFIGKMHAAACQQRTSHGCKLQSAAAAAGLLQPLRSCVRKGCNSPMCAPLVMTAGTQSFRTIRLGYMCTGKCMQQHVNSQQHGCKLRLRLQ